MKYLGIFYNRQLSKVEKYTFIDSFEQIHRWVQPKGPSLLPLTVLYVKSYEGLRLCILPGTVPYDYKDFFITSSTFSIPIMSSRSLQRFHPTHSSFLRNPCPLCLSFFPAMVEDPPRLWRQGSVDTPSGCFRRTSHPSESSLTLPLQNSDCNFFPHYSLPQRGNTIKPLIRRSDYNRIWFHERRKRVKWKLIPFKGSSSSLFRFRGRSWWGLSPGCRDRRGPRTRDRGWEVCHLQVDNYGEYGRSDASFRLYWESSVEETGPVLLWRRGRVKVGEWRSLLSLVVCWIFYDGQKSKFYLL